MRRPTRADGVIIAGLILLCVPIVGPALLGIVSSALDPDAWADIPLGGVRWSYLIRSVWVAGLIAVIATVVAMPVAQVLRGSGVAVRAALLAPLWMPAWLIYAGLNLARAPDTALGGAIIRWALPEHREALVLLGRTLAIGSMALWCLPVAALVLASVADQDADAADELLETERLGWAARFSTRWRMRRGAVLAALVSVALLTLGSAVPLHLAQVETDTIALWRALADRTPDRWGGVWLGSFPQIAVAALGAAWLVHVFGSQAKPGESAQPVPHRPLRLGTRMLAWSIWSIGSALPILLMALSLDSFSSVWRWVDLNLGAIASSASISAGGAIVAGLVGVLIASAAASDRAWTRRIAIVCAVGALFGFLAPGVLVGAAVARFGAWTGWDESLLSVIASAARTGFVGAIGGLILARSESPEHRAMRRMDAMGGGLGWIMVDPRRAARLYSVVALGAFVLGLHEIQASVLVRPPGSGNLPQQMLADLHYARLEQLSAGGVVIGSAAILFGVVIGMLAGFKPGQPASRGPVPPTV